jgi:enamine deaminase RidA (YjgF/YER057c/UK114 family)
VVDQTHLCFRTVDWALRQAGSSFADVVRARIIMTDAADDARVAPVVGQYLKPVGPALTTCVAQLLDPRLKIEIDVTALSGSGQPASR